MPGVGGDLQDHFYVRMAYRCAKPMTLNDVGNSVVRRTVAGIQYFLTHFGPARQQRHLCRRFSQTRKRPSRPISTARLQHLELPGARTAAACGRIPGRASASARCICAPTRAVTVADQEPRPGGGASRSSSTFSRRNTTFDALRAGMRLVRKITAQRAIAPLVAEEICLASVRTDRRLRGGDPRQRPVEPAPGRHPPYGHRRECGVRHSGSR